MDHENDEEVILTSQGSVGSASKRSMGVERTSRAPNAVIDCTPDASSKCGALSGNLSGFKPTPPFDHHHPRRPLWALAAPPPVPWPTQSLTRHLPHPLHSRSQITRFKPSSVGDKPRSSAHTAANLWNHRSMRWWRNTSEWMPSIWSKAFRTLAVQPQSKKTPHTAHFLYHRHP